MSPFPSQMRALIIKDLKKGVVQHDRPVPQPKSNEVLIKVSYVALNPTDWKHLDQLGTKDSIMGCDFSGTVAALGDRANKFKVGDRVCGAVYGSKSPVEGAFAEYMVIREDMAMAVPSKLGSAEAATYGVGFCTAAMAIHQAQGYQYAPADQKPGWFLVSGGSTSVGLYALALLHQLGIKTVATASPHSFDLVRSYGATEVIDYHDKAAAVDSIRRLTHGGVAGALECVGGSDNYAISVGAIQESGGRVTTLTPPPTDMSELRTDVKIELIMLPSAFGHSIDLPPGILRPQTAKGDEEWFVDWVRRAEGGEGIMAKMNPNRVELKDGGLEDILDGLELLRQNKVSGKKLVYKIE